MKMREGLKGKSNLNLVQRTHHATTLAPLGIPAVQSLVSFFASEHMYGSFGVAFGHLTMLWFALLSIGTWMGVLLESL